MSGEQLELNIFKIYLHRNNWDSLFIRFRPCSAAFHMRKSSVEGYGLSISDHYIKNSADLNILRYS